MQITVLGLGQMGHSLAARLVDGGHDVGVWNRSPGRATDLVAAGAREVSTAAEAVAGADVVMSFLTDDDAVRAVLLPGDRPLPVGSGTAVVDCSTVSPATTAALAAAYGERFAACPVLGSPAALAAGEAALAVAGPAALVERLAPVWSTLSERVMRCGEDPGRALVVKLVNNYLLLAGLAVLAEAVTVGQRAGLDDATLTGLLTASPLVAPGLHNRVADLVGGDHDGWFPTPMGAKDVHLFAELGAAHATRLPLADLVERRYLEAAASGLAERDVTAVVELVRRS